MNFKIPCGKFKSVVPLLTSKFLGLIKTSDVTVTILITTQQNKKVNERDLPELLCVLTSHSSRDYESKKDRYLTKIDTGFENG